MAGHDEGHALGSPGNAGHVAWYATSAPRSAVHSWRVKLRPASEQACDVQLAGSRSTHTASAPTTMTRSPVLEKTALRRAALPSSAGPMGSPKDSSVVVSKSWVGFPNAFTATSCPSADTATS